MTAPAPDAPAPKRRRWRWLLLAILLLGALGGAYLYLRDGPPPDDADLMERDPIVPADQNGLVQLRKMDKNPMAFDSFAVKHGVDDETAEKIYSGEVGNETLIRDFLTQTQPDITELKRIVDLPYFADNDKISITETFPDLALDTELSQAIVLGAREAAHRSDYAQAVQDVLLLRRLVWRLMEVRGAEVESIITMACDGFAMREIAELFNDPVFPPRELALLAQACAADPPWNTLMSRSIAITYQLDSIVIKEFKQNKVGGVFVANTKWQDDWERLTLHENTTRAELAAYYRTMRQQWSGPYSSVNFAALNAAFSDFPKSGISYYTAPNLGGRVLIDYVAIDWKLMLMFPYLKTADDRLIRTGLALRQFYDDQHMLPAKLDDLVPRYLPAVPLDPFDDKPLRYNAAKGLVYSVGTSLKDSGGSKFVGKMPVTGSDYTDPISDKEQPTLELKFQKPPAPATPAPAP